MSVAAGLVAMAGGMAAAANFIGWQLGTLLGVAAGATGFAGSLLWERHRARLDLDREWRRVTSPGPAESGAASGSVLTMLNPDRRVVDFNLLRERDLRPLLTWCTDPSSASVRLLAGRAGTGKTRLIIEAADRLAADGWICGWIRRGHGVTAVDTARARERQVLLVVDDADTHPDLAATVATLLRRPPPGVRIVLAARDFGGWWANLRAGLDPELARLLPTTPATGLEPLGGSPGQLFVQATRAFARHLAVPVPEARLAGTTPGTELLFLHAAAAVTVRDQRSGPVEVRVALRDLFALEEAGWQETAPRHDLGPHVLRAAVIAAVLFGAESRADAIGRLGRLPGLTGAGAELLGQLADWLRDLYPQRAGGGWLDPHIPARLAQHYVAGCLGSTPSLLDAVATSAEPGHGRRMLRILAGDPPVVARLLLINPELLLPAVETALAVLDRPIAAAVEALALTPETLATLDAHIPLSTQALVQTAVAVAEARLRHAATEEDRARRLSRLSYRLAEAGRGAEAVTAAAEAVALCRRLDDEVRLAGALTDLGARLADDMGRYAEAAAMTGEAIETFRRQPIGHDDALAAALVNLGVQVGNTGHLAEAVVLTTEAVGVYRRLAAADPDASEPRLGWALNNLGAELAEIGRHDDALDAATEAVAVYRRLAAVNPDAHEPGLALALDNLAGKLWAVRRSADALAPAAEAVDLFRRLAAANPDAHTPGLARALTNIGDLLPDTGRVEDALTATVEAVALRRRLAATNPGAHEPDLAWTLNNLGLRLGAVGRDADATAAATEAVTVYRRLAGAGDAHDPGLARALANLSAVLAAAGRFVDALPPATEAAERYQRLHLRWPDAFHDALGKAEHNVRYLRERLSVPDRAGGG